MQTLRRTLALRLHHNELLALGFSRQQAAAMSKVTTKESGSGDSKVQLMMKALEPQTADDVTMSPEELAEAEKRAKEYSRLKMQQHRQWQTDLTTKLKLKQAAIAALPSDLQAAAMVPDETPFPANRQIWTETPPIEEVAKGPAQTQRTGRRTLGTKKR